MREPGIGLFVVDAHNKLNAVPLLPALFAHLIPLYFTRQAVDARLGYFFP